MILDAGCGTKLTGDVNIDIDAEKYLSTWAKMDRKTEVVIADAQNLPLRENTFTEAHCFVVLPYVASERRTFPRPKKRWSTQIISPRVWLLC